MTKETFQTIAPILPNLPGCYQYYDAEKNLLYVGKAKNLKKRISSYFTTKNHNGKTLRLVSLIHTIEYTVTDTEHDAFLLENSLIKHYRPRYNINLKDDKSYPFIVIKNEPFPRVFITRKIVKDKSTYLGPFTNVSAMKELLMLIQQNIPLRNCNLNLSETALKKGKYKVCLEFHIGNCKGPCAGHQTSENYAASIEQISHLLKGNTHEVLKQMKQEMWQLAKDLHFEKAEILKQKIQAIEQYENKSTVVNPRLGTLDVITILDEPKMAIVNYLYLNQGVLLYAHSFSVEKKLEESTAEILAHAYLRFREMYKSNAPEVITTEAFELPEALLKLTIPRLGDKKNLVNMSLKNAAAFKNELVKKEQLHLSTHEGKEYAIEVLKELQIKLQLTQIPTHIECFDNSNFQGSYPVSAMVCFKEGQPSKKDYRHYHVKTVKGIDDFATMKEVVYRRYSRMLKEGLALPQLVIIDGGKGQLSAALESIEDLGLNGQMALIGLAKREESIFFPTAKEPLQLPFDNAAHLLLRKIRDEVHRFGISFHRQIRSKGTIKNELEEIKGIGAQTALQLLQEFQSVKKIKTLTERELTKVIGQSKARIVFQYFNP